MLSSEPEWERAEAPRSLWLAQMPLQISLTDSAGASGLMLCDSLRIDPRSDLVVGTVDTGATAPDSVAMDSDDGSEPERFKLSRPEPDLEERSSAPRGTP